jgi:hypothetical protein
VDPRPTHFDRAKAGRDRALRQVAVADHLAAAIGVGQRVATLEPLGDFSFDRLGQHPLGSFSKNPSQDILGTDGWKRNDRTGTLGHR